ncbi:hypothetical protein J437_LFUL004624 [Ladona fulva]|uniref:Neurotransmitter-gated ion-channel transmembrane domain-containing protein n=1 Tax=Ladona fulva TaxID=123851 RepID=A0A8K0NX60_LADFU|nr:hypothetical protein J437_LFUL004624 [Ladona fulva]
MLIHCEGSYPAIAICLKFQRRLSYHLLQTYIPSGLFVIVSWVSFLVPRECAPGRLAICMTTLLTLTAMFGAVRLDKQLKVTERKTKKPSSEGKEEENKCKKSSWGCVAPRQLGSGHFRFTESPDENESRLKRKWISGGETFEITSETEDSNQKHRKKYKVTDESLTSLRRNMEFISAIIAPIGFLIFNLWYWPWILLTPSRDVEC